MKTYDVVGIGHSLMDITVNISDRFLEEMSLPKGGMTLIDDAQYRKISQLLAGIPMHESAGGSASNTAKGVSILGGRSAFMGSVGSDHNGKSYHDLLEQMHVHPSLAIQKDGKKGTGVSIICITPDGERTMITYLGAAADFSQDDIDEQLIKGSKILHIEGFFFGNPITEKAVMRSMEIARESGTRISIDLSDPGVINSNLGTLKKVLKEYADIVFVNEHEAKAFTGVEEEEAARRLSEYCDVSIVKIGSRGSIIRHHGKLCRIPINKVKVVNTNGAGDAYAAGILYSIAHDIPMEKAGEIAAFISSKVVSIQEATLDYSLKEDVRRILDRQ